MRLEFTGHRSVRVSLASADEVRRVAGDPRGGFAHNGQWHEQDGVLRISFSPIIKINRELDARRRRLVEQHERRHFTDFKRLAGRMRQALVGLLRHGRDPQMDARWSWFNYDVCVASESYHRSLPDWSVRVCLEPGSSRP
jgi:hypothetical protein